MSARRSISSCSTRRTATAAASSSIGEQGATYLLDLPQARCCCATVTAVLEDGSVVRVTGKPEPLVEISAASPRELARIAWHIGNRHTDVQIVGDRLRIRRDHVLEDMLRGLGATLLPLRRRSIRKAAPMTTSTGMHQRLGRGQRRHPPTRGSDPVRR